MYKVVIAEAEFLTRLGLAAAIRWSEHGLELSACAEDGEQALETCLRLHPDILILDTDLPGHSGMELLRTLRTSDQRVRCIFITAEENISLMRDFLELGASAYLLRPKLTESDLLSALENAVSQLSVFDRTVRPAAISDIDFDPTVPKNSSAFLHTRIAGSMLSEQKVHSAAAAILERLTSLGLWNVTLFNRKSPDFCDILFTLNAPDIAPEHDALYALLTDTLTRLRQESGLEIGMVYYPNPGIEREKTANARSSALLDDGYFSRGMFIFLKSDMTPSAHRISEVLNELRSNPIYTGWRIGKRREQLLNGINAIESSFAISRPAFEEAVCAFCSEIAGDDGLFPSPLLLSSALLAVHNSDSAFHTLSLIKTVYPPALGIHPIYGEMLCDTILYIQSNLQAPLSLPILARRMNLSVNYYASLFKSAVGLSVTEYISHLRLELACELLRENILTIQEISVRCGFTDVTYFSRFFKNKIGLPPQKWRRIKHRIGTGR